MCVKLKAYNPIFSQFNYNKMTTNYELRRYYIYFLDVKAPSIEPYHKMFFASSEDEATTKFWNATPSKTISITKIVRSEYSNSF